MDAVSSLVYSHQYRVQLLQVTASLLFTIALATYDKSRYQQTYKFLVTPIFVMLWRKMKPIYSTYSKAY